MRKKWHDTLPVTYHMHGSLELESKTHDNKTLPMYNKTLSLWGFVVQRFVGISSPASTFTLFTCTCAH